MLAFGEYLGEALRDKLPPDLEARVDDVDCSSVPCLLRVSARLQGPDEKPALASVVGIATDSADGDRPLVVKPGDDDRQRAVLTFTPSDRPELAPLFEAEAGRRKAD